MELEEFRQKRETLDRIEGALAARIVKSDQYLPVSVNPECRHFGTHKYSSRENAFRRLETRKLIETYCDIAESLHKTSINMELPDFNAELARAASLDDNTPHISEANSWELESKARGLNRFSCKMTAGLVVNFDSDFPSPEHYGEQLWLDPFYKRALANHEIPESLSYKDYLINLANSSVSEEDLESYLQQAYDRAHYLGPYTGTSVRDALDKTGEIESEDPLWCKYCEHHFKNENVFRGHLTGKKHKRAIQSPPTEQRFPADYGKLIALMQPQISETIAQIDRKSRLGLEERKIEFEALEAERDAEDNWMSDDDHLEINPDKEVSGITHQPRNADGTPIPRWLFNLQGLGTIFKCEICGNAKYSGRKAFDRHFTDPRHVEGLKELGIPMSPMLNGIAKINDARDLVASMKSEIPKAEREVEDDDGNVMGERMYEDLKTQGLI